MNQLSSQTVGRLTPIFPIAELKILTVPKKFDRIDDFPENRPQLLDLGAQKGKGERGKGEEIYDFGMDIDFIFNFRAYVY